MNIYTSDTEYKNINNIYLSTKAVDKNISNLLEILIKKECLKITDVPPAKKTDDSLVGTQQYPLANFIKTSGTYTNCIY